MNPAVRILVVGIVVASLGIAVVQESKSISSLRQELKTLKDRAAASRKFEDDLTAKLAHLNSEVRVLRLQNADFLKLHHEVRELRNQTNQITTLRAENDQLRTNDPVVEVTQVVVPTAAAAATDDKPAAVPLDFHTREDLAFAGFNTPAAALESSFWALREGNLEVLLAGLTGDQRARFQQQLQSSGKTIDDFTADLKKDSERLVSYSITDQDAESENVIVLTVQKADGENHIGRFLLTRVGDAWRISDIREAE